LIKSSALLTKSEKCYFYTNIAEVFRDSLIIRKAPGLSLQNAAFPQKHMREIKTGKKNSYHIRRDSIMELTVRQDGSQARFVIKGDIDEPGAENLKSRFRDLDVSSLMEVSFDFKEVTHIGSAGIGKLLLFYKDLALNGGTISIQNVSPSVYELFNVLKLDTIFSILRA